MSTNQLNDKQRAKRKQIIDAAISCFIEKGFHATSTAEICKAAGMSPGNLFHYYPTKNAIIEAIVLEDQSDFTDILTLGDNAPSSIDSIIQILIALIRLYNEPNYARISIEIIAEASRNSLINDIFIENENIIRAKLAKFISAGIEKNEIDPHLNIGYTASWLMIITDGSIGRKLMEPEFNWSESLDTLILMIKKILSP